LDHPSVSNYGAVLRRKYNLILYRFKFCNMFLKINYIYMSHVISVTASHGSYDLYFSYNDVLNADRGVPSDKRPRASVSYSMRKQVFNFVAIRDSIFR
jgi:hypothetical protein